MSRTLQACLGYCLMVLFAGCVSFEEGPLSAAAGYESTNGGVLNVECSPFDRGAFKASAQGKLKAIETTDTGFELQGHLRFTIHNQSGKPAHYSSQVVGNFILPNTHKHFRTNIFTGEALDLVGFKRLVLSLWPANDSPVAFSAIYDQDGNRYEMDCSESSWQGMGE